jgi:amino acid adenylation domain-containing protein
MKHLHLEHYMHSLSFAQQRLWFLHQLEGPSAIYNVPMALRLEGNVQVDALQQAIEDVVARHEPLRTIFAEIDGISQQNVLPADAIRVPFEVIPVLEEDLPSALSQAAGHHFDLVKDIPIKVSLFRLDETKHVLLILMHHIASDGESSAPFARDLATAYSARCQKQVPNLPALPVSYADYAHWQRQWHSQESDPGSAIAMQMSYWRKALAGMPEQLNLPTDRSRSAQASHVGGRLQFAIDSDLYGRLLDLARQSQVSLFMALQAAVAALLFKLGAGTDIPLGTSAAGRTDDALHDLVGFFVNMLILRTDVSGDPSFRKLLARVRDTNLDAYSNQDVPFERLVEMINPDRASSSHAPFQVVIVMQHDDMNGFALHDLSVTSENFELDVSKFDLTFSFIEQKSLDKPESLNLSIEFSRDIFDESTIHSLARWFSRLLDKVVLDPDRPLNQIHLLGEHEHQQMLTAWNDTAHAVPALTIPQRFEKQVAQTPDAVALVCQDVALTYAQLDARANQLAHHLQSLGAGPDVLVGVCLERSADMVVALLGTLKAGAAYLPLDPTYPTDRLALMLSESMASLCISQASLVEQLAAHRESLILFDDIQGVLAQYPQTPPACATHPDHLAYVIYTSGSTGRPKGVAITHANLGNTVLYMGQYASLREHDNMLARASISFDASAWEIWQALLHGATVHVLPDDLKYEVDATADYCVQHGITVAVWPPSMLPALVDAMPETSLRHVFSAGEALPAELARRIARVWSTPVANLYGPTEAAIQATLYAVDTQVMPDHVASVPLGTPIWNTQVYVLDAMLQPVPPGVPGELYLAGAGLARGYLHRPVITAERFVANPFGAPGTRLYRTGDRVRWLADGNLEYLGRTDHQVKLRGFRVELGEIESALLQYPAVTHAAVIAREDTSGQLQLVGYVVTADTDFDPAIVRRTLSEHLPDYMVPAAIVRLDTLPLTRNGKLDHKALPAPEFHLATQRAPSTPQEAALAALFAEVLGLERVGVDDSFFELGGHSLLATRLVGRIRAVLKLEVPIRTIFQAPSVAELARKLDLQVVSRPELRPYANPEKIPLSFAQQRLWFLHQLEGSNAVYNIPFALRLEGNLQVDALQMALDDVIARHEPLRTTFIEINGSSQQNILPAEAAKVRLEVIPIDEKDLPSALSQAAGHHFDLAKDIPIKVSLFELDETQHVLLILMHHIASDGGSRAPFARDLAAAYSARYQKQLPNLSPLPVSYADYALWQQDWHGEESDPDSAISIQKDFWRKTLADIPEQLNLPTDRSRSTQPSYRGENLQFEVDSDLYPKLIELARQNQVSLFMVLQAAVVALLFKLGAGTDIPLGTSTAGRTDDALHDLVGFFVNMLVLRTDVSGNPSFRELLSRVRHTNLDAYSNQDVPFEKVVDMVRPERVSGRHPLFQVLLTMDNNASASLDFLHLTHKAEPFDFVRVKYDLIFSFTEHRRSGTDRVELTGELEFSSDLFDRSTANAMIGRLQHLLEAVLRNPDQDISSIDVLSEQERQQVTLDWNKTSHPFPSATIPEVFENWVARQPDATALIYKNGALTYAELDAQANQMANHLRDRGAGADVLVALCLERSPEAIIAMLGVLKAGAAYLHLDPEYPVERLSLMLAESMAPIVVTQESLIEKLPSHWATFVIVDTDREAIAGQPGALQESVRHPEHLACTIFTSGSTGKPKGVAITHRSIVAMTSDKRWQDWHQERVLVHSPQVFDASTHEIWTPLLNGMQLVIADAGKTDISLITSAIERHNVTALFITTALFRLMAEECPECFRSVRTVWSGGEAASAKAFQAIHSSSPNTELVHAYGPAEGTTFATCCTVHDSSLNGVSVPIGSAMDNIQTYVLDEVMQPVPVGVPGELYIGGARLARGYLNGPALTAERFIANPFGAPGSRLYRTGDIVRWLPDSNLAFLGRADHQVKIRGFRIETGEIEAALSRYPGISQAVVIPREDHSGQRQLVAYVVPTEAALDPAHVRRALDEQLPDYMVPSAIIMLDALPLTLNGKLDRKSLPAPDFASSSTRAPRTPKEELLATLFAEILGVEQVGIDDSFFNLGGDSILAIQLAARAKKSGIEFELASLFDYQTVAELAGVATEVKNQEEGVGAFELIGKDDFKRLPSGIQDAYPISHLQMGMFFHGNFDQDSTLYRAIFRAVVEMPFAEDALRTALDQLSCKHEVLRTSFALDGYSEPLQLVHEEASIFLEVCDYRHYSEEDRRSAYEAWYLSEKNHRFILTEAPLLRVFVHRISDAQFDIALSFHHAIMDGWSDASFITELLQRYLANVDGKPMEVLPLSVRYSSYIALERETLNSEASRSFWRNMLADARALEPHRNTLAARSDGAKESGSIKLSAPIEIDAETNKSLVLFARKAKIPLKTIAFAVHLKALSVIAGSSDVTTCFNTNGRPEVDDGDRMIGLFLNAVPMRMKMEVENWHDFILRAMHLERDAMPHRRYPLPRIISDLGLSNPFKILFNYTNFHVYSKLGDQKDSLIDARGIAGDASFELQVNFMPTEEGVWGVISGTRSLYDEEMLERYARCYVRIFQAIVQDPYSMIENLSLLDSSEMERLATEFNKTERELPLTTMAQLFEDQAAKTPRAPAIANQDRALSYEELNVLSNRLAHQLISDGVGPEDVVAISLPRSFELIIAVLAVLKAGAAYLLLDLEYPQERLRLMLRDARAAKIITRSDIDAGSHTSTHILLDDPRVQAGLASMPVANPTDRERRLPLHVDHPAYVIYTSGSTGKPKCVVIPHRGVVNHLLRSVSAYYEGHEGGSPTILSASFDGALTSLFGPLLSGQTLRILEPSTEIESLTKSTDGLYAVVKMTPSHLNMLNHACEHKAFNLSKVLMLGGESLLPADISFWREQLPQLRIVNQYGPTETSIGCCTYEVVDAIDSSKPVPIGRPIWNTKCYVLNESLHPVPIGSPGELYIGGAGLARGYLNEPALTAARFIASPFGEPGSRLYRTGDIVRWLPDGNLDFLGRTDHQVKIRGFRIEMGEIEAALSHCPGVSQTAVVAREDHSGQKHLVAYVVPNQGALDPSVLRRALSELLPDYMVPSAIVMLDALPLTPNGKLDRRALPAPDFVSSSKRSARTPKEQLLATLFAEVLGIEHVGMDDSFFDLGGHSLLATRLISRIRKLFHSNLPIRAIYDAPSVSLMAKNLSDLNAINSLTGALPLRPKGTREPLFCLPPAGNLAWCYAPLVGNIKPDCAIYGLQAPWPETEQDAPRSFQAIVDYYTDEIRKIQPNGPYHLVGWSIGGLFAHAIATKLQAQGEQIQLLALVDAYPRSAGDERKEGNSLESQALARSVMENVLRSFDIEWSFSDRDMTSPQEVLEKLEASGAVASGDLETLKRVLHSFNESGHWSASFSPAVFQGNAILFRAEIIPDGMKYPSPQSWEPYVSGALTVYHVNADHYGMLGENHRQRMGEILSEHYEQPVTL